MDTIFAVSTAPGKSGVAVVRLSGGGAHAAVAALAGDVPPMRRASLRVLRGRDGGMIDSALVLAFGEGSSFTGEAAAELQVHGSMAVVSALMAELAAMPGLRAAEPGEFTRRALENGRLDLAQVEGLADLIEAETEAQRRQAVRVLAGELGGRAQAWREGLVRALALLEAGIDFADEDVPADLGPQVRALVDEVAAELRREIAGVGVRERIRNGFEVAIVGRPNVGKSSLLNALAGRQAAITSARAGTTRDVIEVRMDLRGLPVTFLDTAGLRETADEVEAMGIELARARAAAADLRVFLVAPGEEPGMARAADDLVVVSKADLYPGCAGGVSALTGAGLEDLVGRIAERLSRRAAGGGLATRERHRAAMARGLAALEAAVAELDSGTWREELAAEELRAAVRALDFLLGRVDVESVLDEIFARFCLGK
ncbi:MAG: tRNA uridine-5-carboxymethylaminomethyl(34) synthesis GTPase MnmE [Roseovarius sp.]